MLQCRKATCVISICNHMWMHRLEVPDQRATFCLPFFKCVCVCPLNNKLCVELPDIVLTLGMANPEIDGDVLDGNAISRGVLC